MLSKNQLQALTDRLKEQKEEFQSKLNTRRNSRLDLSEREASGELSSYDNHPGDLGTELFEREKDVALETHEEEQLHDIKTALAAIEEGTYGVCKECGKDIPFERLEAIPSTLYCLEHSHKQKISNHRPSEEDIIRAPQPDSLQRTYDHRIVDYTDSYQEVAQYGTSETPADMVRDAKGYDDLYPEQTEDEGFVEDIESFVGNGPDGERKVYQSEAKNKYEERLENEDLESDLAIWKIRSNRVFRQRGFQLIEKSNNQLKL